MSNNPEGSLSLCIGLILFLSMNLFIRTGKVRNYLANKTQGLVTLLPTDLVISKNELVINFIGKDSIEHTMRLSLAGNSPMIKAFTIQRKWAEGKSFLFMYKDDQDRLNQFREEDLYKFLDQYDVYIKEIRTYGANIIFLRRVCQGLTSVNGELSKAEYKSLISESIEYTASRIGHTKQICKSSYIATQILNFLNRSFDDDIKKITKLKDPISILNMIK